MRHLSICPKVSHETGTKCLSAFISEITGAFKTYKGLENTKTTIKSCLKGTGDHDVI